MLWYLHQISCMRKRPTCRHWTVEQGSGERQSWEWQLQRQQKGISAWPLIYWYIGILIHWYIYNILIYLIHWLDMFSACYPLDIEIWGILRKKKWVEFRKKGMFLKTTASLGNKLQKSYIHQHFVTCLQSCKEAPGGTALREHMMGHGIWRWHFLFQVRDPESQGYLHVSRSVFQAVSSAPPCSSLTSSIRAEATRSFERLVKDHIVFLELQELLH